MEVKDILEEIGYKLYPDSGGWRAKPIYRDSNNNTSLKIFPNGNFIDFSANINGNIKDLIRLTLGIKSQDDINKWLGERKFFISKKVESPKISMKKSWKPEILNNLIKTNDYWNKRGISDETLKQFRGGVAINGAMSERYVFPIFKDKDNIIGFAGRDITDKKQSKWKLINSKSEWVFPFFLNKDIIKDRGEVILVEGISDVLQMWEYGYKNCISLFGTKISDKIISSISSLGLKKIIISTNNDYNNNFIGNRAAVEIYKKLISFVDKDKVKIKLPVKNDFQEMSRSEIDNWKDGKNLAIIGSRTFDNIELLYKACDLIVRSNNITGIVSGGAAGADSLGRRYAIERNIPLVEIFPEWKKEGKSAGFVRNEYIILNSDIVIAFWDGKSNGTIHSIRIAERLGKKVEIIRFP